MFEEIRDCLITAEGEISDGNIYYEQKEYEKAIDSYDEAVERCCTMIVKFWGLMQITNSLTKQKTYKMLHNFFEEFIHSHISIYFLIGNAYRCELKQYQKAIEAYQKCINTCEFMLCRKFGSKDFLQGLIDQSQIQIIEINIASRKFEDAIKCFTQIHAMNIQREKYLCFMKSFGINNQIFKYDDSVLKDDNTLKNIGHTHTILSDSENTQGHYYHSFYLFQDKDGKYGKLQFADWNNRVFSDKFIEFIITKNLKTFSCLVLDINKFGIRNSEFDKIIEELSKKNSPLKTLLISFHKKVDIRSIFNKLQAYLMKRKLQVLYLDVRSVKDFKLSLLAKLCKFNSLDYINIRCSKVSDEDFEIFYKIYKYTNEKLKLYLDVVRFKDNKQQNKFNKKLMTMNKMKESYFAGMRTFRKNFKRVIESKNLHDVDIKCKM
ncbi:MAG: tetratricopeptide repeat protein [Gammaproteobacteria bacterium]|jgi:tetratricopeptide (TPR) repeat protein